MASNAANDARERVRKAYMQMDEIDRVYRAYPHLNDDDFARSTL